METSNTRIEMKKHYFGNAIRPPVPTRGSIPFVHFTLFRFNKDRSAIDICEGQPLAPITW